MAVTSSLEKVTVTNLLNNGTKDGKIKTLSVSIGNLNTQHYDDQKAMNICTLLEPCFSKPVLEVKKTAVSRLTEE